MQKGEIICVESHNINCWWVWCENAGFVGGEKLRLKNTKFSWLRALQFRLLFVSRVKFETRVKFKSRVNFEPTLTFLACFFSLSKWCTRVTRTPIFKLKTCIFSQPFAIKEVNILRHLRDRPLLITTLKAEVPFQQRTVLTENRNKEKKGKNIES